MNPYNYFFYGYPFFYNYPTSDDRPPLLHSVLNAIANFDKSEEDKIKNNKLAEFCRGEIFDFEYVSAIPKEELEKMILNKFIMRRIGYETLNAFKIALEVKMNEIMPLYNIMYTSIENWNLFKDGETLIRKSTDDRNSNTDSNLTTDSTSGSKNVSDRRFSDLPQSNLDDVKNGSYITEYNLDTSDVNSTDNNKSTGNTIIVDKNVNDTSETRTPADKVMMYKNFLEAKKNIYTLIFKDLEQLFYGLI